MTVSLFGGLAGVAWVLDELAGPEAGPARAHLDAALWRHLDVPRWEERFDLDERARGRGRARGEPRGRAPRASPRACSATSSAPPSSPPPARRGARRREFLPAARRACSPRGEIDLGVAHGAPGVVGVLARFVEAGVERARSRRLLEAAVAWLIKAAVPAAAPPAALCGGTTTPHRASPTTPHRAGPGGATAPPAAPACCCAPAARSAAPTSRPRPSACYAPCLSPARRARSPPSPTRRLDRAVPDASFCHGAAGLAHVHNAAFQLTGDRELRRRAVRWLAALLRMRRPGAGIAGYRALRLERGAPRWAADPTLLSGAVGVALVLLAAVEDREPAWQRLFLL